MMKNRLFLILSFLVFGSFTVNGQTAVEIIQKSQDLINGAQSYAEMDITIIRPKYTRTMSMKSWTKGEKYALMLVTAPVKDKGTVFLKRDKEVWNWVPNIDRSIKLPPSMMSQGWMGTDMTNDDLIRQTSLTKDFTHTLHGTEMLDGMECYKITLVPKANTAVVWGKITVWIEKVHFNQLKANFYDEDDELVNTFKGSEMKKFGNKTLVSKFEMIPADKPGNKTMMIYKTLDFQVKLSDDFFTTQNMKKVK
jgi:hypothetical protein